MPVFDITVVADLSYAINHQKNSLIDVIETVSPNGTEWEYYYTDYFDLNKTFPVYSGVTQNNLQFASELALALNNNLYSAYTKNGGYYVLYRGSDGNISTLVKRPSLNPL